MNWIALSGIDSSISDGVNVSNNKLFWFYLKLTNMQILKQIQKLFISIREQCLWNKLFINTNFYF